MTFAAASPTGLRSEDMFAAVGGAVVGCHVSTSLVQRLATSKPRARIKARSVEERACNVQGVEGESVVEGVAAVSGCGGLSL